MGVFKNHAADFQWINGHEDEPQDLCLHGHVTVQIGDTVLEDDGTVSATALYLPKTLTEDKVVAECDIQMIPCCPKELPADELDRNGYIAFWNEWHRRYKEALS